MAYCPTIRPNRELYVLRGLRSEVFPYISPHRAIHIPVKCLDDVRSDSVLAISSGGCGGLD